MSKVSNQYNRVRRRFEDSGFVYTFYTVWVIVVFVILGLFALRPTILAIIEKRQTIEELKTINANLNNNLSIVENIKNSVLNDTEALSALDAAMPERFDVDGYVLDYREAVTSAGYVLKRVDANSSGIGNTEDSSVSITSRVTGPGNFPMLIKNIEKLKRLTSVSNYTVTIDTHSSVKGDSSVGMILIIYIYGGGR